MCVCHQNKFKTSCSLIIMKTVYCFILVSVLQLCLKSHCFENNVCKTIQDYYTIKNNSNCEYDVAADPDADPVAIITFNGYPAEIHKVTTVDGYILTLFRIPNYEATYKKGPVFLQHGWYNSAANFLGLGKQSLPFILADAGYDVWLGNYRGTEYSEEHVNLTVLDKEYWDHGIDEIGLYDIPAQLGHISQATGNNGDITYIGHSLGTGVALIYSSTFPEHARRTIKLLILLAPVSRLPNVRAALLHFRFPVVLYKPLLKIIMNNDLIRVVSQAKFMKSIVRAVCFESPLLLERCLALTNLLFSGPQTQTEPKTIPVAFNQLAAGSSFKIAAQLVDFVMGNFRRFNYGSRNFEKYGSYEPPPYELKNIQVPIFLAYAINDWATTPEDSQNLYNNLPPKVRHGRYEIRIPNFNHGDFLYGKNAKSIVYDVILRVLNSVD